MTRINNLLKSFNIAAGLLGALYIGSPKISLADGITEEQCLTNYQPNNLDCQDTYKKYFVIGTQGPVTNTPGGCENNLDDDGDTLIDNFRNKADPDCFTNGVYNPSNTETKKNSKPYTPQPSITPGPTPEGGGGEEGEEGQEETQPGAPIGGRIIVNPFYMTTSSTTSPLGNGGIETDGEGTGIGGNLYLLLLDNGKARAWLNGSYSKLEDKMSNEFFKFSFDTTNWSAGVLAQLYFNKLVLEPGISYGNQTQELTNNLDPGSKPEKYRETKIELELLLKYYFNKGDNKWGIIGGAEQEFLNQIHDDPEQGSEHKNINLGNYPAGVFFEGNITNIPTQANTMVELAQNYESDKIYNTTSILSNLKFGKNYYVIMGAQIPIDENGLTETSYYIGIGRQKFSEKFPVGVRGIFQNQTMNYETELSETESQNNIFRLTLTLNEPEDWFNTSLNPFIRIR